MEKNRIPAADSSGFANWRLPEVESGNIVESGGRRDDPGNAIVARPVTARELEAITSAAHREGFQQGLEEGRSAGQAQGLQQGLAEGRAVAQAELQQQVAQLQGLMAQLLEPLAGQEQAIEEVLTRLALDIGRAVLDREPALDAQALLPVVRAAVRELPVGERNITVLLNPQQLELVRDHAEWPASWQLQPDSRIESGGCRVVTEHSLVDYSIELRFRQVAARLLAERDAPPPEPGLLLEDGDD